MHSVTTIVDTTIYNYTSLLHYLSNEEIRDLVTDFFNRTDAKSIDLLVKLED